MAQWDVYANPSVRTRDAVPYLVDLQSDLFAGIGSRLVAPLVRSRLLSPVLPRGLCPAVTVAGEMLVLMPHEAGPISPRLLKDSVASLRAQARDIVAALDAVVSGV